MTDAMFEVPQSRLEEMTAELKRLHALETRIQNAFAQIDMPTHESSLGAAVEEMLSRWVAGGQENNELRAERDALKKNLERLSIAHDVLAAQVAEDDLTLALLVRARDAARADAERLAKALQEIIDAARDKWSSAPSIEIVTIAVAALAEHQRGEG